MALLEEASSSSSSSSTNTPKYDVYLNFHGTDTRRSFISHLHKALVNANLKPFYDAEDLEKGKVVKQELESAIKASRASIVVLSKNYAYSKWCLNDLVLILEQHRDFDHIVIPIFYHVDPSDVRRQRNSFGDAMEAYKKKMEAETNAEKRNEWAQNMEIWKNALTQVADLSGLQCQHSGSDVRIIEEVVNNIRSLLTRYDVFISFYDLDTRLSFTSHLRKALEDANLKTFLDDRSVKKGVKLDVETYRVIKESKASVIVLSKNYASSSLCLDELVLILEQYRSSNHIVIPIFHHVEPTHVRRQESSFGDAMKKHKQRMKAEKDVARKYQLGQKIEYWKKALTDVAAIAGFHHTDIGLETEIIEEVIAEIYRKLGILQKSNKQEYFIGMDDHVRYISSWLDDRSSHSADFLTIFGIGGSGKTSLAKYVYSMQSLLFDRSSFIEDISRKCSEQSVKLLTLQKQLLSQISEPSLLQVNDVSVYTAMIQKALRGKKVLLVLDDVNSLDQLKVLLGYKGFHPGSKIIITTRDASLSNRYILHTQLVQPNHTTLALNGLDETSSLQLLCFYAFNRSGPTEDYEQLCKMIVKFCEGSPLALTVMGSFLCGQNVNVWKSHIARLNHEVGSRIGQNLQMSFDSLPSRNDKELFLHISCFFVGMDRDITETILNACDISTILGIRTLVERCLLTIGPSNKLMMHPLVQEMGRDVVRQESPNKPWMRSRLWCHEDSFEVLKQKKGSRNLLGLTLDMKQEKENLQEPVEIEIDAFSKMENLMLLQLNYVKLKGSYKNFPEELRWLCMHGFPLGSIPSDLPMENLVALDLSYSKIEFFDMSYSNPQELGKTPTEQTGPSSNDERLLGSLKILNLSFCEQLQSVSGFVKLPALERLIVSNCNGLIEVSESIGHCVELVTIDVSYCRKLERLPATLKKLTKLKAILQDGCNLVDAGLR